jgi:hypothetical protein
MSIGVEYASCHRALFEIFGEPIDTIEWTYTCIELVEWDNTPNIIFNSYFEKDSELEHAIEKFWELHNIQSTKVYSTEDKETIKFVDNSL